MSGRKSTAAQALRVAIDARVLLASLLRGDGRATALRQAWQAGRIRPLVSPAMAQQLMRGLAFAGFGLNPAQQQELLADFLPYAEVLRPLSKPAPAGLGAAAWSALELAAAGQAGLLVSDDPALQLWLKRSRSAMARAMCDLRSVEMLVAEL
ncbi:PIN domain-containing protein [Paucibacter soli]|uniref:PIN domain-containing protein n=1 Tax=Paucibacter soli TaxID=3133433 RepID=UPI0030B07EEB